MTSPAEARERIADYLASRERRPLYGDQIASGYDGSQLRLSDLRAAFTAMNAVCEAAEQFVTAYNDNDRPNQNEAVAWMIAAVTRLKE